MNDEFGAIPVEPLASPDDPARDLRTEQGTDGSTEHWIDFGSTSVRVPGCPTETPLPLSPRERQILLLTVKGKGVKAIAGELGISYHTVDTFRRRLYRKLGVTNSAGAAAIGMALFLGAQLTIAADV